MIYVLSRKLYSSRKLLLVGIAWHNDIHKISQMDMNEPTLNQVNLLGSEEKIIVSPHSYYL